VEREQRLDGAGFTELLRVRNTTAESTRRVVELTADVDFADQFQIRTDGRFFDRSMGRRSVRPMADGLEFEWFREKNGTTFAAESRITTSVPADQRVQDAGVRFAWDLELPAHTTKVLRLRVGGPERHDSAGPTLRMPRPVADPAVGAVLSCSCADLESLLIDAPDLPGERVPAAGAPWFLTLFGRDALLTSVLAGSDLHDFRPAVLRTLAATRGRRTDPRTLEQPGRIVHEVRSSELAVLGDVPYRRYYGSVDVTALFLAVLGRTALGDEACPEGPALAVELKEAALAAIEWLRTDGGLADRGFVTYSPDPNGLVNQGWKDSEDSTTFADGRLAEGPIALVEVQGYAWDALRRSADLAAECWQLPELAAGLAAAAADLRARFLDRFWLDDKSFPAMALDGSFRPVDALGSNAGHLLWSGILPEYHAQLVTERLLAEQFWTGWGIRTLAADQHRYSPLSYHNGSVWPHDSMIAALGMRAHRFDGQARDLARGVVDAGLRPAAGCRS
jgi:glycogen debranching enzyme